MQVKKQQLKPDMEQLTGSKLGKEYIKAVYCHPAYLIYIHSGYTMRNAGLEEAQDEIKMPGEISVTSDTQVTPPLRQKAQVNERAS